MTDKQLETLTKVYNLAVRAGTKGEASASRNKLKTLCKKHKIKLSSYIKDCQFDFDFSAEVEVKTKKLKTYTSRRAAMKSLLQENIWDFVTLAQYLSEVLNFGTYAKCKHACSGMSSDMKKNAGWIEKVCDDGRRSYITS